MPLLDVLAERFGAQIIREDGSLDRAGLATIAFADDESLADLNRIVHPAVREEIRDASTPSVTPIASSCSTRRC